MPEGLNTASSSELLTVQEGPSSKTNMNTLLASLPLQLVCQFIIPGAPNLEYAKFVVNQSPSRVERATLPDGFVVPSAKTALLAVMPMQLVCQILLNNPDITETSTLVPAEGGIPRPTAASSPLPEGYVIFPEDHAAYKIFEGSATWIEARDRCISEGTHLAIIDSHKKIEHIKSMKQYLSGTSLHVGIYKSNSTNEWVRVDNDIPVNSIPWKRPHPHGSGDCAIIAITDDSLMNHDCDKSSLSYVCQISMD